MKKQKINKEVRSNKDLKVDIVGDYLKGKSIALCITGGIAAIETPKIARQLRRYGASVKAYTTKEALKFIGKASLEWATEQEVVDELSGMAEHICIDDLVLVAPATTNTINKIFVGIADNPVTTLVASALGTDVPVYIAPAMHGSLYKNPFLQENLAKAEQGNEYNIHKTILTQKKSFLISTNQSPRAFPFAFYSFHHASPFFVQLSGYRISFQY